jgi:tryptophan synthase beta chain
MAGKFLDMQVKVYMVKVSYEQKPYRKSMMETWGATVVPSPTTETNAGRGILAADPDSPGSLGIAISEAVEDAATHDDTKYSLGSVLNHVLMHQTVIGQEAKAQLEKMDAYPDMVVGCVGGGSSFGGIAFPFLRDKLVDGKKIEMIAVEPEACPTITRGEYAYDFGDTAEMTPLVKMHTLGHTFVPARIHAGGLRYHGMAPLISALCDQGLVEARSVHQNAIFGAAVQFAQTEGIISAPEPAHAIHVAIQEALKCKETGEAKNILFLLCGHGYFDMSAYDAYFSGKLEDFAFPEAEISKTLATIPQL